MSGGDFRTEILIVALVVSAGVHISTMFVAKPMVMAHGVVGELAKAQKHPPMRVTRNTPPPPPVKIDAVPDVEAVKDEPEAILQNPKPLEDLAEEARAMMQPEVPQTVTRPPEPEDRVAFDIKPIDLDRTKDRPAVPMAKIDLPKVDVPLVSPKASPQTAAKMSLALPELPVAGLDDTSLFAPSEAERRVLLDRDIDTGDRRNEVFVPVTEVTEKVDERLVAREKEAVRELFDIGRTVDLTNVVRVGVTAMPSGAWTYFRVTFSPLPGLSIISKDVVILLDASGSIGRDRIRSVREAAKQILRGCMNSGDRFNLVAFRDKYEYASKKWMECDRKSFEFADGWLDNLVAHGRTDVFATIRSVLTLPRDPSRPLIALVVTDGDANSGVRETAEIISKFTELNDGLVSVYMYGVRQSGNKELIDILTRGNRGESFVYGGWLKWKAGSQIESLTERFRDPVLTDLRVVFAAGSRADAYPRRLRNLYKGDTVQVVGRVPTGTKGVSFSIKGLNGPDPYESYFRLPLDQAPVDPSIEAKWTEERQVDAKLGF